MAGLPLIDRYLTELRGLLGHIRRADEICAEARDHLLAAVERHQAAGMDLDQAQQRALADYGESRTVARSFLKTRGGVMVPRPSTRLAGTVAIAAAAMWSGLAAWSLPAFSTQPWDGGSWFWLARGIACALTFWAVAGLIIRHGGANGALGLRSVLSLALIAVSWTTPFTVWSAPSWLALLGLATLLVGSALWSARIAPRRSTLLFTAGPLVAMVSFWAAVLAAGLDTGGIVVPFPGEPGAFSAAGGVPTFVGMVLLALGLGNLGHWMYRETPVEGLDAVTA